MYTESACMGFEPPLCNFCADHCEDTWSEWPRNCRLVLTQETSSWFPLHHSFRSAVTSSPMICDICCSPGWHMHLTVGLMWQLTRWLTVLHALHFLRDHARTVAFLHQMAENCSGLSPSPVLCRTVWHDVGTSHYSEVPSHSPPVSLHLRQY